MTAALTPVEDRAAAPERAPWEYRRKRDHLFPHEPYRYARTVGAEVRAYCGVVEFIPAGDPSKVKARKTSEPIEANDCPTCIDVWHGRPVIRL